MRTIASDHGIELTGLHWLLVSPEGLYLTAPDDSIYNPTVDYLRELVRFCGEIGGQQLVLGSNNQRNIPDGGDYDQGWARARGVTTCISEALLTVAGSIRCSDKGSGKRRSSIIWGC